MIRTGHIYYLQCACGHGVEGYVADLPEAVRNSTSTHIDQAALDRLVCTACGRRGRPAMISGSYATGHGYKADDSVAAKRDS